VSKRVLRRFTTQPTEKDRGLFAKRIRRIGAGNLKAISVSRAESGEPHDTAQAQNVLQPRSARLSRRVRKSDRMMLSQQPVIRNLTGMESPLNRAAGMRAGPVHARTMPELRVCCRLEAGAPSEEEVSPSPGIRANFDGSLESPTSRRLNHGWVGGALSGVSREGSGRGLSNVDA
jgi:hypothetical protein